jgi:hypothetical protein
MGGPRKPPAAAPGACPLPARRNPVRGCALQVLVSPDEKRQIAAQAAAHGRSISGYLRALALDESFRRAHARYVGHLAAKLAGHGALFAGPGEEVGG